MAGLGVVVALAGLGSHAADWPQWRGPDRTGISKEGGWLPEAAVARVIWKASVGSGYSAVAVVGERVVTMGNAPNEDTVWCLSATNGAVVWKKSYPCAAGSYPGPRVTPTVEGQRVYTFSRAGLLLCLDLATGDTKWQVDLCKEAGAQPPQWGFAGSPLMHETLVIVNACAAGCAVDKATGRVVWKSAAQPSGYASPVAYTLSGQSCVAIFGAKGLTGVEAATGTRVWDYAWETSYDVNAPDPIIEGSKVLITSGYGRGAILLDLAKVLQGHPTPAWPQDSKDLAAHFTTPVLWKGYLYGIDGNAGKGQLRCLDFATGAVQWTEPSVGFGGLMLADGRLIILNEKGILLVADAAPGGYKERLRSTVLGPTCWTMPVLANGRIYCRNEKGDLACVELTPKPTAAP